MSIGILTSGGDCPGLNAVIRGVVLKGTKVYNQEIVGFRDGWRGVVQGDIMPLVRKDVQGISKQGGTILGTSRTNPFEDDGGAEPTHLCHCPGHVMTVPEAPVAFTPKIVAAQVLPELVDTMTPDGAISLPEPRGNLTS